MTGKQRIEQLTQTWYGFAVFGALASVVQTMLWPFSAALLFSPMKLALTFVGAAMATVVAIVLNVIGLAIGLFVIHLFGRALVGRSSLARVFLVVVSVIGVVLGALSALKLLWAGVFHVSLSPLLQGVVAAAAVLLYVRSYRVLTDPSVKSYIG
jgi:hypothetical protein